MGSDRRTRSCRLLPNRWRPRGYMPQVRPGISVADRFLNPESVHPGKRHRIIGLKAGPVAQIVAERVVCEARAVPPQDLRIQFETDEVKSNFGNERLDLIESQALLMHVKKQVAAFAGRIEVRAQAKRLQLCARMGGQLLAEPANVSGCARISACGNHFTRLDHGLAPKFAV